MILPSRVVAPRPMDAAGTGRTSDQRFDMTYCYRGNIYEVQGEKSRACAGVPARSSVTDAQYTNRPATVWRASASRFFRTRFN